MSAIDVSATNILSERGVRYKRNALAASLIATVLYWTDAPLGQVNLFGVTLSNVEDQEAAAWTVFLAILSYQWVMLAYYGWRDWRVWQQRIRDTFYLSPVNIAFWMRKGAVMWEHGAASELAITTVSRGSLGINWTAQDPAKHRAQNVRLVYGHQESIRWRLLAFSTIEFGLPFLWGFGCLCIAISKIFS